MDYFVEYQFHRNTLSHINYFFQTKHFTVGQFWTQIKLAHGITNINLSYLTVELTAPREVTFGFVFSRSDGTPDSMYFQMYDVSSRALEYHVQHLRMN